MSRGRWQVAAGLGLVGLAAAIALSGLFAGHGTGLSSKARGYPSDTRKTFVHQVRAADGLHELAAVKDDELVNRGAAFCVQLAKTGSSLKATFALQLAKQTHPGDVYVTSVARHRLCPQLPDQDTGR